MISNDAIQSPNDGIQNSNDAVQNSDDAANPINAALKVPAGTQDYSDAALSRGRGARLSNKFHSWIKQCRTLNYKPRLLGMGLLTNLV